LLPDATSKVWEALRARKELGGFVLIGGTALALLIAHRRSEDLDLVWPDARLPSDRVRRAVTNLEAAGFACQVHDSPAALAEFLDTGLELHDYQQDYLIGGVKVAFFAADSGLGRVLSHERADVPRVASLREVFASKCLVSAKRSRLRDWFDLYVLFRDQGFTLREYVEVFETAGDRLQAELGLTRLCSGHPDATDEGFVALTPNAPSTDEMRAFFVRQRDELEVALAASTFKGS